MWSDISRRFLLLFISALILSPLCFAEEGVKENKEPTKVESTGQIRDRVVSLSKLTTEQVDSLRTKNLGWGEILHVGAFVAKGQSFDTIVADRAAGMGWGEIAKKYGFKLGEIRRSVHADLEEAKKAAKGDKDAKKELAELKKEANETEKGDKKAEKAEKPEKSAKPAKPEHPAKPSK